MKPKNLVQNGHIDFGSEHVSKPTTGSHVPHHKVNPKWAKSAMPAQPLQNNEDTLPAQDKRVDTRSNRNGAIV